MVYTVSPPTPPPPAPSAPPPPSANVMYVSTALEMYTVMCTSPQVVLGGRMTSLWRYWLCVFNEIGEIPSK